MSVEIRSLNDGDGMLRVNRGTVVCADDLRADELTEEAGIGNEFRFVIVDSSAIEKSLDTAEDVRAAADESIETSRRDRTSTSP